MFVRTQTNGDRTYLIVVENERIHGKIHQRVLHRLGRLDELLASGQLDALLHSLGRFSDKYAVLGAHANGESITTRTRIIGPPLIFERLWRECGVPQVLADLLRDRHFEFPVERAVFLTVLRRPLLASPFIRVSNSRTDSSTSSNPGTRCPIAEQHSHPALVV